MAKSVTRCTLRYLHRDVTQNLRSPGATDREDSDFVRAFRHWLHPDAFRNARLFTSAGDLELKLKASGRAKLFRRRPSMKGEELTLSHDRPKSHLVDTMSRTESGGNFLVELGVVNAEDGKPKRNMASKLRQIQRFVEIVSTLVARSNVGSPHGPDRDSDPEAEVAQQSLPRRPLHIVDVGCGRGYLTFACHAFFAEQDGREVRTTGIEMRR